MEEMKDRLKELRKTLGLKQREITERLEISIAQYSAWESGKEKLPRARLYQLCNEYGVRREWLESGTGEMFEPEKKPKTADETRLERVKGFLQECPDELKRSIYDALKEEYETQQDD